MKQTVLGILAHVDAGKTTLSEALLYETGVLRRIGRVDHGDTFLDTNPVERSRGITVFSKQALLPLPEKKITLLDTPGHVDFSAETERVLQVLDAAVLVISGPDGVQGHTETLWKLLKRYEVPVFLFVNKMDQPGCDPARILSELKKLDQRIVDFTPSASREEEIAMCSEELLDLYLNTGKVPERKVRECIAARELFPCLFGSALRDTGVKELLGAVRDLAPETDDADPDLKQAPFGARVFKVARDPAGNRLTFLKVTSGLLKGKMVLSGKSKGTGGDWEEKTEQVRLYSGDRFEPLSEAGPGQVCAVTGLTRTFPGEGLGAETEDLLPVLEPVMSCQVLPWGDEDPHRLLAALRKLEEEEPELHVVWNEALEEIHVQLMGTVQTEILKTLMQTRFGIPIRTGPGHILYKETIAAPAEGAGHFEPLKHYAEVRLLLEPAERGSGITVSSDCRPEDLDGHWQRLILSHILEREHPGVLTGAPLTDVKITLLTGRAHEKHTESGDFRQAVFRAIRQGLKKARCRLLEPWSDFKLSLPADQIGRAMADMQKNFADFSSPELKGDQMELCGRAPSVCLQDYAAELASYSRGRGRFFSVVSGYDVCHNEAEVLEASTYDSELDFENPTGSVFCSHGAGYYISWEEADQYMHTESPLQKRKGETWQKDEAGDFFPDEGKPGQTPALGGNLTGSSLSGEREAGTLDARGENRAGNKKKGAEKNSMQSGAALDAELQAIFERTYGSLDRKKAINSYAQSSPSGKKKTDTPQRPKEYVYRPRIPKENYLLVDGYNIVHAWDELRELAEDNLDGARGRLLDLLCSYQGFHGGTLIVVFDAYKVKGNIGTMEDYHNIHVVYTKEAQTADEYIARLTHEIGRSYPVTVATSDNLEQLIVMGQGAVRVSAREFLEEVNSAARAMREEYMSRETRLHNTVIRPERNKEDNQKDQSGQK